MDSKRKEGLKKLKIKLSEIVSDEELNCNAKLEKLYDDNEIIEFI